MGTERRLVVAVLPLLLAASLTSCARIGGPAPVVAYGASSPQSAPRPVAIAPAPVESQAGGIVVRPGDTLYALSRRYNAPMRALTSTHSSSCPSILAIENSPLQSMPDRINLDPI